MHHLSLEWFRLSVGCVPTSEAGCGQIFSPVLRSPHICFPPVWETHLWRICRPRLDFTPVFSVDLSSGCFVVRGTLLSLLLLRSRCSLAHPLAKSRVAIPHGLAHSLRAQPCWSHSSRSSPGSLKRASLYILFLKA